ncbi:MAG: SpoIID/LytB domain-containing protein [Smithellaceae bacterium]
MLDCEPKIKVALLQNCRESQIALNGNFTLSGRDIAAKLLNIQNLAGNVILRNAEKEKAISGKEIFLAAGESSTFSLDVQIGIDFHWQRTGQQTFRGNIILRANPDSSFHLINEIPVEDYLASVISSEMSAQAPLEFLKAQAITARSWLAAMLERKNSTAGASGMERINNDEIIRWHDTNDHEGFDVCADDHCQRYQGITRITSAAVNRAIQETRGIHLVYNNKICDARYYKACGGRTEVFASAWEDQSFPYLQSVTDHSGSYAAINSEEDARKWLLGSPVAYCNTQDTKLLSEILPSFDQETIDFYRWQVNYVREELEELLYRKSGIDFGTLQNLLPVERGPSGRISKLKISGTKQTVIVGKELEIRRWLSPSHLLSSAFIVSTKHSPSGVIERFILNGGGWGHGVGLCQIGAAVMASKGFSAEDILSHYFSGAKLQKLYG